MGVVPGAGDYFAQGQTITEANERQRVPSNRDRTLSDAIGRMRLPDPKAMPRDPTVECEAVDIGRRFL